MNVISNLIYGTKDENTEEIKESKENIKEIKIFKTYGKVNSIEEWECYYVKINNTMFILKRDNIKMCDILEYLKTNKVAAIDYIIIGDDKIIMDTAKIYKITTTIKYIKTDNFGNTYITISPDFKSKDKNLKILLNRKYCYYHIVYNKLEIGKTFKLRALRYDDKVQIIDIDEPDIHTKNIAVIGTINIYKEKRELNEYFEIVYENHDPEFRFLIDKSNSLDEKQNYKITYRKCYGDNFYLVTLHEKIV